jgi:hypothetical protein
MSMCGSCSLSTYLKKTLGGPDGVGFSHGVGKVGRVGRVGVGDGVGLLGGDGCRAVAG